MENGMITTQLTPHNRLCFVPTSKILIPPSSRVKCAADSLADSLAARFADSGGGGGGIALRLLKLHMCVTGFTRFHSCPPPLPAPGQRRRHLPSSAWTRRREVKQGKGAPVAQPTKGMGREGVW